MAEVFPKNHHSENGREILLWHLEENLAELEGTFRKDFSAATFRNLPCPEKRRKEVMAEFLLLKRHVDATLSHDDNGAPLLIPPTRNISISHCPGYVCICLSNNPVGIDIERWGARAWRVKEKFLATDELQLLEKYESEKTATLLWCAKEAAFKLFREKDSLITQIRLSNLLVKSFEPFEANITATSHEGRKHTIELKSFGEFALAVSI